MRKKNFLTNKIDFEDINIRAAIAFALLSIALLLSLIVYFVFVVK